MVVCCAHYASYRQLGSFFDAHVVDVAVFFLLQVLDKVGLCLLTGFANDSSTTFPKLSRWIDTPNLIAAKNQCTRLFNDDDKRIQKKWGESESNEAR